MPGRHVHDPRRHHGSVQLTMVPRPLRSVVVVVAMALAIGGASAPAVAAWSASSSGTATGRATTLTAPSLSASPASGGCANANGNGAKKISITVSGLPIATGRVELARSTTSNGQTFAAGTTTIHPFTGGALNAFEDNDGIQKGQTYYYKARVLPPSGSTWVGPISPVQAQATC